jgi:hypothetical protein
MSKKIVPSKALVAAVKKAAAKHGYKHQIAFIADAPVAKSAEISCPKGQVLKRIEYEKNGKTIVEYVCRPA